MRKGFVYIIGLLVFSIIIISCSYMLSLIILQTSVVESYSIKTQSYYNSLGKIYKTLSEEKYYDNQLLPVIISEFRRGQFPEWVNVTFDPSDLVKGDYFDIVNVSFYVADNKKHLKLSCESILSGVQTSAISYGPLVDKFFELGIPILSPTTLKSEDLNDYNKLFYNIEENISIENSNLPSTMVGIYSSDYDNIKINKGKNNYEAFYYREDQLLKTQIINKNEVFILIKNNLNKPINLTLGDVESGDNLSISGVIYIEGDVVINSNLIFNGIIILNKGNIFLDSQINVKINGVILIDDEDSLPDNLEVIYNRSNIYLYGTYIPGFLNPRIEIVKRKEKGIIK